MKRAEALPNFGLGKFKELRYKPKVVEEKGVYLLRPRVRVVLPILGPKAFLCGNKWGLHKQNCTMVKEQRVLH